MLKLTTTIRRNRWGKWQGIVREWLVSGDICECVIRYDRIKPADARYDAKQRVSEIIANYKMEG